ncbi:MAG: sulfatase-like hydrolase/transferase [Pirellulales bacterium]|nr:sulfatase-like hydrolase/transferase [Pirellulales bacterium]
MYITTRYALAAILAGLSLVPFSAAHAADGSEPAASARPNIVFIITDQHFAEVMSCRMGKRYLHTPAMDRLSQTGMLFTRAYSPNPLCMPTRILIRTGYYPRYPTATSWRF